MNRSRIFKSVLVGTVAALALAGAAFGQARSFDVPAGDLKAALDAYIRQAGVQLIYRTDDVRGKSTRGVHGAVAPEAALEQLLAGSGVVATRAPSGAIVVAKPPQGEAGAAPASEASQSEESTQLGEIVVTTGSRIRGAPPSSPVIRLSQEDMRNAGNANLGDAIRELPQNFSGGKNPAIGLGAGTDNSNPNSSSQLNLRGLGPDASLTLLNGRRLAYNAVTQGIDITAIPLDAVDRVEIVADGSSALYGADAVGGVANVILKRDYNGLAATARFGAATEGGAGEQQYSLVGGRTWGSGGFIATVNYEDSTAILARQRSYTSALSPSQIIYPPIKTRGVVLSGHQRLSEALTFNLDAAYNDRSTDSTTALTAAPYTTSGSASHADDLSFTVAPSIDFRLPGGWSANASVIYGRDNTRQNGFSYSAGVARPTAVLKYNNSVLVYEFSGEGPIVRLPAGEARLAVGAGYRHVGLETFRGPSTTLSPKQNVSYGFGELYVPILGRGMGGPKLALTAAARYEDYGKTGSIVVPKVGVIVSPTSDFDLKASWGRSFKSPTLNRQFLAEQAVLFNASQFGVGQPADRTVLYRSGGNADVTPERAESWSITAEFHPRALPRLNVAISYFDVAYTDRIVTPIASIAGSLDNPLYAQFFTRNPSPALQQSIIAAAAAGFTNAASGPYDPAKVVAILDARYTNAARQDISGVDVQARYTFDLRRLGDLTASGSLAYLSSNQTLLAGQPSIDLSGIVFNPPKTRGSLGLTWRIDDLVLSPQALYSGPLTDNRKVPTVRVDDQVTYNLTARYNIETRLAGLNGLTLSVSVLNITNAAPEQIATTALQNVPYESTNYTPLGRFVSAALTARW